MTILITGATGNIGSRVVEFLLQRSNRPRILVRNAEKAQRAFGGRVDIYTGNLADPETLKPALTGVDALFLVNTGPELANRDDIAAKLAKKAGVKHLVKLSALSADKRIGVGDWHAQGEEAIRHTAITSTFLRSAGFMSNVIGWASSIRSLGAVRACTGDGKVAYIHPADVAAVAATVLLRGEGKGATLSLTGPTALTYAEMTLRIGEVIGRRLRFEHIDERCACTELVSNGVAPCEAEAIVALWSGIREGQLGTVTNEVEGILGRKPTTFDSWVRENVHAFG